jgi:vacuolar-type H+-ATPase subunit I/STV1
MMHHDHQADLPELEAPPNTMGEINALMREAQLRVWVEDNGRGNIVPTKLFFAVLGNGAKKAFEEALSTARDQDDANDTLSRMSSDAERYWQRVQDVVRDLKEAQRAKKPSSAPKRQSKKASAKLTKLQKAKKEAELLEGVFEELDDEDQQLFRDMDDEEKREFAGNVLEWDLKVPISFRYESKPERERRHTWLAQQLMLNDAVRQAEYEKLFSAKDRAEQAAQKDAAHPDGEEQAA